MLLNLKRVNYTDKFIRDLRKAPAIIRKATAKRIEIFLKEPFHPQLNNHQLTGNYKGFRSINISGDWRAIFSEFVNSEGNKIIIFKVLGTHSQLYK